MKVRAHTCRNLLLVMICASFALPVVRGGNEVSPASIGLRRNIAHDTPVTTRGQDASSSQSPSQISRLKFSANGRYALAQNASAVYVLTHDPFRVAFRIEAPAANAAWFTPDSKNVVVSSANLKVDIWGLESRQRSSSIDGTAIAADCLQTDISPNAKYVACLNKKTEFKLYDLATQSVLYSGPRYYQSYFDGDSGAVFLSTAFIPVRFELARIAFSPDERYVFVVKDLHPLRPAREDAASISSVAPFATPKDVLKALQKQNLSHRTLDWLAAHHSDVWVTLTAMGVVATKEREWDLLDENTPVLASDAEWERGETPALNLALDLGTLKVVRLYGTLDSLDFSTITFLSPTALFAKGQGDGAYVVDWPSGKFLRYVSMPAGTATATDDGNHVVLRAATGPGIEIRDTTSGGIVIACRDCPAIDVFGDEFIAQSGPTEIGLYGVDSLQQLWSVSLPESAPSSSNVHSPAP